MQKVLIKANDLTTSLDMPVFEPINASANTANPAMNTDFILFSLEKIIP